MKILRGKEIADNILQDVKEKIVQENLAPQLAVILIGTDEASRIYVNLKEKAAQETGIMFCRIEMDENVSQEEVLAQIASLNGDEKINGIIVQLPLPAHLDKNKIIQSIDARKDVDGFHVHNIFMPVFPNALLELLKSAGEDLKGKKAVILCNSQEFGEAMQKILEKESMSVQYVFRSQLPEKLEEIKNADVLITACGQQNLISAAIVKEGVTIVDGGIVRFQGKVRGDVDSETFEEFPGSLSPVPGGVGPVTIACLLKNVYFATKKSQ